MKVQSRRRDSISLGLQLPPEKVVGGGLREVPPVQDQLKFANTRGCAWESKATKTIPIETIKRVKVVFKTKTNDYI